MRSQASDRLLVHWPVFGTHPETPKYILQRPNSTSTSVASSTPGFSLPRPPHNSTVVSLFPLELWGLCLSQCAIFAPATHKWQSPRQQNEQHRTCRPRTWTAGCRRCRNPTQRDTERNRPSRRNGIAMSYGINCSGSAKRCLGQR